MIMRMFGAVMNKTFQLLPALLLLAAHTVSFAQKAGKDIDYPGPVADWLAHARQECAGGFRAGDAVRTVSLSGDGKPGYIIDPHRLVCGAAPEIYGGLGPVPIALFVTLPSGQVIQTGAVVALDYRILPATDGDAPIIAFDTHELKERAGSVDNYRWDGHDLAPIARRSMALPPDDDITDAPSPRQ